MTGRRRLLAVVLAALAAANAFADTNVELGNGDKVTGSVSAAGELESFEIVVPARALLSVSLKGKKSKTASALASPRFRVLDAGGAEPAASAIRVTGAGAKLVAFEVPATGRYRIVVTGQGTGDYQIGVAWKSLAKFSFAGTLDGTPISFPFGADAGAVATFTVKAGKGSGALPRFTAIQDAGGQEIFALPQPAAPSASHTLKGQTLPGGSLRLAVDDGGAVGGGVTVTMKLKAPPPSKRSFAVTAPLLDPAGGAGSVVGKFIGPAGGELSADAISAIAGASVSVPAGALSAPTVVLVGTSPALDVPDVTAAGPTVFFGPEGLTFGPPETVTVTLPFTGASAEGLRVFTRDAKGKVTEITAFTADVGTGLVTFAVSHFSSFRVFRDGSSPSLPRMSADLDGDGVDELVVPASRSNSDAGRVFVFRGGPFPPAGGTADANFVFAGAGTNDHFGEAVATGDVNGDGVADLVVGAPDDGGGKVHVFFGGTGFAGAGAAAADLTFGPGDGGFGRAVAIGDLDGDGFHDIVVGAPESTLAGTANGAVFVFSGGPSIAGSSVGEAALALSGDSEGSEFGSALAIGEISGDGVRDLVIAAPHRLVTGSGKVFVLRGGGSFLASTLAQALVFTGEVEDDGFGSAVAVGDVDGDGTADLFASSPTTGSMGRVYGFPGGGALESSVAGDAPIQINGADVGDGLGSSLGTGDYDGDGDDELVAGAGGADDGPFSNTGGVYTFGAGVAVQSGSAAEVGRETLGEVQSDFLQFVLAPADVNDDGIADLAVGAPRNDGGGNNAGAVYLMFGADPFSPPGKAASADRILRGAAGQGAGGIL